MRIQVFSEYLQLAQAGKVDFLACPMHKEDEPAIFTLAHTDQDDKVLLYCLACGYKNIAGQQLYDNLLVRIERAKNEPEKVDTQKDNLDNGNI